MKDIKWPILIILIFQINITLASEQCFLNLTQDYKEKGKSVRVDSYHGPNLSIQERIQKSLNNFLIGHQCMDEDMLPNDEEKEDYQNLQILMTCQEIVPKHESSYVCYTERKLGYFIISTDGHDSVVITFNSWD